MRALPMLTVVAATFTASTPAECPPLQEAVRLVQYESRVFAAPSSASDSIGHVAPGDTVTTISCAAGGWCAVRLAPELVGFVREAFFAAVPVQAAPAAAAEPARRCCRVCTTGTACGNSCIARNRTCRQPRGCACNG